MQLPRTKSEPLPPFPTSDDDPRVADLLERVNAGEPEALDELLRLVQAELRDLARGIRRGYQPRPSLLTTELIQEAYLRLFGNRPPTLHNRAHFLASAARAMRWCAIEVHRREKGPQRGGGWRRIEMEEALSIPAESAEEAAALHDALERLSELDPQLAELVDLRVFGGLKIAEIAALLDMSLRSTERAWRLAKNWLYDELRHEA